MYARDNVFQTHELTSVIGNVSVCSYLENSQLEGSYVWDLLYFKKRSIIYYEKFFNPEANLSAI